MNTDSAGEIIAIQPQPLGAEATEWTLQRVAGALQVLLAARRAGRIEEVMQSPALPALAF